MCSEHTTNPDPVHSPLIPVTTGNGYTLDAVKPRTRVPGPHGYDSGGETYVTGRRWRRAQERAAAREARKAVRR
jgi:hypothetical protein